MSENIIIKKYLSLSIGGIKNYVFSMKIKDILPIYYVAVRGQSNEQGAVQRVLNKRRITSIKEFVLEGNSFYNLFILNWSETEKKIEEKNNELLIPNIASSMQVIDGQHRLEGLKAAADEKREILDESILVLMTNNLSTEDAARIFVNINAEQKPVPQSLVFDLFGEIKPKDFYIVRAKDIATKLNDSTDSPYYRCIKMPGVSVGTGKFDLSTIVSVLKQFTKDEGVFSQYNLNDFESQYKVVNNFLTVLKEFYDEDSGWMKTTNPFITSAGCYAAIEFCCNELISRCAEKKSFEQRTIRELIPIDKIGLMQKSDINDLNGKAQREKLYKFLKDALLKDLPGSNEYKF